MLGLFFLLFLRRGASISTPLSSNAASEVPSRRILH
jgi:hypothetical protein